MEIVNSSSDEEENECIEEVRQAFHEIDNYKEKRVDIEENLAEYWESKKYSLPWLRRHAFILHLVPAMQVSV